MADEGWLLAKRAELLSLECELQAAIAENKQREHLGQAMAYTDFSDLQDRIESSIREIMANR